MRLKGLDKSVKRLASGEKRTYWYAWRGGPRLSGKPGSAEFIASYNSAIADRRVPTGDKLADLVARYRASPEWNRNAPSTKAEWIRWLDRIRDVEGDEAIGDLTPKMLDDRRVRKEILAWRDQWAATPRQADYGIQVLSRVLSWSVDRGMLAINAAAGIQQLYRGGRADRIWLPSEIEIFLANAGSPEVAFILQLAILTGLRRDDLATLNWSHVGALAIVKPTGKSRGRKSVRVPLLTETRALLDAIRTQQAKRWDQLVVAAAKKGRAPPPKPMTVLSNTRGLPWTPDGIENRVIAAKAAIDDAPHLHDARGTFATRLRKAGLSASEIADVVGWEEDRVQRLLAVYVDNDAIVMDIARRLEQNEPRPKIPN